MDQEFSYGEWIRKRRKILGLTQAALAEKVGYSAAMMRKIENDERRPSPQAAALLANALEIPPDQQDAFLKVSRQEQAVDRLVSPAIIETFPWQAASQFVTNLPVPATLFVGREEEMTRLANLLQNPACSLVTLVGLAGIGKTRLALQAAQDQAHRFPHGVHFVSLAPLVSPDMIVATISNVLGFRFQGTAEPQEQLLHYLRTKRMLLVLDNFEHLIEGANLLSVIMQTAPGVQLLVTSRELLNLQGEWVFAVEGLPYPSFTQDNRLESIETFGAVQLFLQGAVRVNPSFNLSEENQEWVVRICQLMEGMPLGIELAATWVRVLSCQAIAREIESNLDFLRASAPDIPERHKSLRAALDHSWKLLSEREKEVFPRLSVFRGGFGMEAAQEVARAGLEEVASLLDKSLLKRVGEERYDLHEVIRQYGAVILASNPQDHEETCDRHSNFYAALLEHWKKQYRSPMQKEILYQMDVEIENVSLAWSWMVAHQNITNIQRSQGSLWHFYAFRGRLREGAALFGKAVAALKNVDGGQADQTNEHRAMLGHLLTHQGYFIAHLDQYEDADDLLQQGMALLHQSTDRLALAESLAYRSNLKCRQGEFAQARQFAQKSLELNQDLGEQLGVMYCLNTLSEIHLAKGAYQQAYQLSSESLTICRKFLGDPHGMTECMINLSAAARNLGQHAQAKRWAMKSLRISKTLHDRWGMAQILRQLGLINLEQGETRRAEILIRQSLSQAEEIGDRTLTAMALIGLGMVTARSGATSESREYFLEALRTAMQLKTTVIALQALVEIAMIEMRQGAPELALELVIHSLDHPATHAEVHNRGERLRAELVTQLTPQQIEAIEAQAQTRTLESLAGQIFDFVRVQDIR